MDTTNRSLVVGVFDDRYPAEKAVDELQQSGFGPDEVGFVLRRSGTSHGRWRPNKPAAATEAISGAVTGGVIGGIVGAAVPLVIPGAGPVLAAGMLATSLGNSAAAVADSGILGALAAAGLSEDEADYYERELIAGRVLVTVRCGTREGLAKETIRRHGGWLLQRPGDHGDAGYTQEPGI